MKQAEVTTAQKGKAAEAEGVCLPTGMSEALGSQASSKGEEKTEE